MSKTSDRPPSKTIRPPDTSALIWSLSAKTISHLDKEPTPWNTPNSAPLISLSCREPVEDTDEITERSSIASSRRRKWGVGETGRQGVREKGSGGDRETGFQ